MFKGHPRRILTMTFEVDGWEDELPKVVQTEASDDEVGH